MLHVYNPDPHCALYNAEAANMSSGHMWHMVYGIPYGLWYGLCAPACPVDCSMAYGLWHALLAIAWPLDWSMIYGLYSVACEPPKNLDTTHHRLTQRTTGELSHTWFCASALQHGLWAVAWPVACSMACGL